MKKLNLNASVLALGVASAFSLAPVAYAQIDTITVTAERREASLQDVAIAVTALDKPALQNRQIENAQDLERVTPSLIMRNNITSPTNLSPSFRGSTQQDASLIVAESPFGIYVDDIYLGRLNGNNVALADIERVEVLRGPQGTLYGRNTLAGAIKFVSRTPSADNEWLDVQLGAGEFDRILGSISYGVAMNDSWAMSASAQVDQRDGFFTNAATGDSIGEEQNVSARVKLHYTGHDRFRANGSFSFAISDNDALQLVNFTTPNRTSSQQFTSDDLVPTFGFYTINRPPLVDNPAPIEEGTRGETTQLIGSYTMEYDLTDDVMLKSITGYVRTEDFFNTDFSGLGLFIGATDAVADQITQEFQVLGSAFEGRLDYILGAFVLKESADQAFGWNFFTNPVSTSDLSIETVSYSAFTQLDYAITENLTATAGIRYTFDDKEFDISLNSFAGPVTPSFVSIDDDYDAVTPKFGLSYDVPSVSGAIDSMLIYASAARGFKSGGFNGINISDLSVAQSSYAPETNWTYEGGVKTDLFDSRLRVNAAYFYNEIDNLVLNARVDVGGNPTFPVQNAGDATIQGFELEVTAAPVDGLNLFLTGAVLDGEFGTIDPTSSPAQSVVNFGVEAVPPQVPEYSFTIGFDYGVDLDMASGKDTRLILGADLYVTDEFVTSATQEFVSSPYERLNGFVGLEFDDTWELRLSGTNLLDEEDIMTGDRGFGGFFPLPPRQYLVTLRYSR